MSDFFEIQRGVRQGCPLSPYLFVLAVEMLAKAIRRNKKLSGFLINNEEIKLSQYADDTTLILDGPRDSLKACLQTLDDFYKVSGLKLNDKKTEALRIGSKCGCSDVPFPERNFKWPKYKVKTLEVWLSVHPEETAALNYDEKLENVRNILSSWNYRRLTLMGRIVVLKSLVVSQLVYVLSPLLLNEKAINPLSPIPAKTGRALRMFCVENTLSPTSPTKCFLVF